MHELTGTIKDWLSDGKSVALATVIKTWGSSPRQAGAGMAVSSEMDVAGSVSGGCVEGAVIDQAVEVMKTGEPTRLHFGVGDDQAWDVGLACGGEIDVFVRGFSKQNLASWDKALNSNQVFCSALCITAGRAFPGMEIIVLEDGTWLGSDLPDLPRKDIIASAKGAIQSETSLIERITPGEDEFFLQIIKPQPALALVGGVHIAIPLVRLAEIMGFEVVVIDPRKLFSTVDRFPEVKRLFPKWPEAAFEEIHINRSTAIVMLTHDPKIDDPAIKIALNSPAFYIGALGSKKTHQKRVKRLLNAGVDKASIEKIHAPVGLDLGGRSPQEIALSIMAEIIQVWNTPH